MYDHDVTRHSILLRHVKNSAAKIVIEPERVDHRGEASTDPVRRNRVEQRKCVGTGFEVVLAPPNGGPKAV